MKRSAVNEIILEADRFIRSFGFRLPPFAYWSPDDFSRMADSAGGILSSRLGWDITDYGQGSFDSLGLVLFTVRNGVPEDLARGRGMCYAEKIMISRRGQVSPMHRHNIKAEDIINRGGGKLAIELFGSGPDGVFDSSKGGEVRCDGVARSFAPGEAILLEPGESVTLMPGDWHAFWGEGGDVLIGEVSTVNDDLADNVFRDPIGRFPEIVEDCAPVHLLVSDYDSWLRAART